MKAVVQALALFTAMTALASGQSPASRPDSHSAMGRSTASYTIVPMGDPNNDYNLATAISSNGIVAGSTVRRGVEVPFVYQNGTLTELGEVGFVTTADGVNSSAAVIATVHFSDFPHPILYTAPMNVINIPVPNGIGSGINDSGCVVGSTTAGFNMPWTGFLYCNGTVTPLPNLPGCATASTFTYVNAINAAGRIVGSSTTTEACQSHAFLLKNGVMKDLGTLGGNASTARAISTNGFITGESYITAGIIRHAFLYKGSKMKDLGTLPGCTDTFGTSVNKHGIVVGYCYTQTGDTRAILYDGKNLLDLNALIPPGSGWNLRTAYAINDKGQIVGAGTFGEPAPSGYYMGFLLTPERKTQP